MLAAVAGAASVLAMAPFFAWPTLFVTFPLMIWILDAACARDGAQAAPFERLKTALRAAGYGWAFGFGYFLAGIYWVGYAFLAVPNYDPVFTPIGMVAAVIGLAAGLGLFYAAAAALAALLWRRGYSRIAGFVFAFFLAEAARGHILTGFPWNLFGQALAASDAQMQAAAYIGVYGLTLAALFIFTAPAAFIAIPAARYRRRLSPSIFAVVALAASYFLGLQRLQNAAGDLADVRIRIVQPNIPQRDKWKPERRREIFERLLSLSRGGVDGTGADIGAFTDVLWPESSVPFRFMFNGEIFDSEARALLAALIPRQTTLIIGAERAEGRRGSDGHLITDRFFNSLFVLRAGARIETIYDKVHLVPFGEYMPFGDTLGTLGLRALSHQLSGFEAGSAARRAIEAAPAPPFTPLICYEVIFPGFAVDERARPQWLVNLTNDAWYGESTGPYQHLQQARVRAVEEGLPIMRSANTGVSAVIDPYGRILAQLELGKTGVIDHVLPRSLPVTFYARTRLPAFIALFLFPLQFYLVMVLASRDR